VAGRRLALLIANDQYQDAAFRQLNSPSADVEALRRVLSEPKIGNYQVTPLSNAVSHRVKPAIEAFFAGASLDDQVILYFSGHGCKDDSGDLYLITRDSQRGLLDSTAVSASFVRRQLDRCRSRRKIVILDCCYASAFPDGVARGTDGLDVLDQLSGRGSVVMTSASEVGYAFERGSPRVTEIDGGVKPSVFTGALIDGLETGDADQDGDGLVDVKELYDYVYHRVREAFPQQTPGWRAHLEGTLYVATSPRGARLPAEFYAAAEQPLPSARLAAVGDLVAFCRRNPTPGMVQAARALLNRLAEDDSRKVAEAAGQALDTISDPARQPGLAGRAGQPSAFPGPLEPAPPRPPPASRFPFGPPAAGSGTGRGANGARGSRLDRRVLVAATAGLLAVTLAALLVVLLVVRPDQDRSNTAGPARPTPAPTASALAADCASGTLELIGSTAFGQIAVSAADAYMSQCREAGIKASISVIYGNNVDSASGATAVETAVSKHSAQAGSMIAMYDGVTTTLAKQLRPDPIGVLVYSVVAHTGLIPGSNTIVPYLQQLYGLPAGAPDGVPSGVPGKVSVGLQDGSAERLAFLGYLGERRIPKTPGICAAPTGHAVSSRGCTEQSYAETFKFVNETPNAIGYVAVNGETDGHPTGYPDVSVISIGGAAPTPGNVQNGSYAFTAVEHLYASPQPSALANRFLAYLPEYLAKHQPPDFLLCSRAPASLATACAAPR
jgi:ABC-type phosphate transport system substrate-binding protein